MINSESSRSSPTMPCWSQLVRTSHSPVRVCEMRSYAWSFLMKASAREHPTSMPTAPTGSFPICSSASWRDMMECMMRPFPSVRGAWLLRSFVKLAVTSSTLSMCKLEESSFPSTKEFMLMKESQERASLFAKAMLFLSAFWPGNLDALFMKAATTHTSAIALLFIRIVFALGAEVRFAEDAHFPKQCFILCDLLPINVNHAIGVSICDVCHISSRCEGGLCAVE